MVAIGLAALIATQTPPVGLHGHIAVRIGDSVLVAGGITYAGRHNSAWTYSIKADSWRAASSPSDPRSFAVGIGHIGRALVMGGIAADGSHSDRIDVYDVVRDQWSNLGKLPEKMSRAAGTVWNGKAYLSGGYNGIDDRRAANSAKLWEYDLGKRKWRGLQSMSVARHGHCLVAFKGRLWAIGGYGSTDLHGSVESYDVGRNTWRKEPSLPSNRGFFGAGVVSGVLVVFGAIDGTTQPVALVDGKWKPLNSNDISMRRFAYVQSGDKFLVFGGEPNGAPVQRFSL